MKTRSLFFTALAITLFVSPLAHAKDDFVGTFGKWHVQTYVEGRSKVCLMWSQPEKSKGKYKRRGACLCLCHAASRRETSQRNQYFHRL